MKITYLLGAGASAQCLPIVQNIPKRLADFQKFIHDNRLNSNEKLISGRKQTEVEEVILQECDEIISILENKYDASIDTYAKRLRLTAPHTSASMEKYKNLKAILSGFFVHEQLKNRPDTRYDTFFASILMDSHTNFPENLRVMTWNYDFQFEKSYSKYSGKLFLSENQSLLRVFESGRQWMDINGFGIYKLNGTTSILISNGFKAELQNIHDDLNSFDNRELVGKIVNFFDTVTLKNGSSSNSLSFAWEEKWSIQTEEFLIKTERAIQETEVLVIIGYSFPFFNRLIDRKMFKSMWKSLNKIYIQDINPINVERNLLSVMPNKFSNDLIHISNCDQFFLPPEL